MVKQVRKTVQLLICHELIKTNPNPTMKHLYVLSFKPIALLCLVFRNAISCVRDSEIAKREQLNSERLEAILSSHPDFSMFISNHINNLL